MLFHSHSVFIEVAPKTEGFSKQPRHYLISAPAISNPYQNARIASLRECLFHRKGNHFIDSCRWYFVSPFWRKPVKIQRQIGIWFETLKMWKCKRQDLIIGAQHHRSAVYYFQKFFASQQSTPEWIHLEIELWKNYKQRLPPKMKSTSGLVKYFKIRTPYRITDSWRNKSSTVCADDESSKPSLNFDVKDLVQISSGVAGIWIGTYGIYSHALKEPDIQIEDLMWNPIRRQLKLWRFFLRRLLYLASSQENQ